ncbi:MAG: HIRAN domain-containing protein [Sphingobium sp.]
MAKVFARLFHGRASLFLGFIRPMLDVVAGTIGCGFDMIASALCRRGDILGRAVDGGTRAICGGFDVLACGIGGVLRALVRLFAACPQGEDGGRQDGEERGVFHRSLFRTLKVHAPTSLAESRSRSILCFGDPPCGRVPDVAYYRAGLHREAMPRQMSLAVVGADHLNKTGPARRFEIALCLPGEPVDLIPEPKNPADPNAIAVVTGRGVKIGYIRADRAPLVGTYLSRARISDVRFQQAAKWGAIIRIGLDGERAVLPEDRVAPPIDDDTGFWPDYIPPDD